MWYSKSFFGTKAFHSFHLVDNSPLPILVAFSVLLLTFNIVFYLHPTDSVSLYNFETAMLRLAWIILTLGLFTWFITVIKESAEGHHTLVVRRGLRYGMLLFIVSEVMFFFAFFFGFFYISLAPSIAIGYAWPPKGVQIVDVWGLPLTNTIILLSSGRSLGNAHKHLLVATNYKDFEYFRKHLLLTIILGIFFLCFQKIEYTYGISFAWKENIYGSLFFILTGFHGLHVIIGVIFLLFCLVRALIVLPENFDYLSWVFFFRSNVVKYSLRSTYRMGEMVKEYWLNLRKFTFSKDQHVGFEAAAWYWHFVDVVWIFLFVTVYWWGSLK